MATDCVHTYRNTIPYDYVCVQLPCTYIYIRTLNFHTFITCFWRDCAPGTSLPNLSPYSYMTEAATEVVIGNNTHVLWYGYDKLYCTSTTSLYNYTQTQVKLSGTKNRQSEKEGNQMVKAAGLAITSSTCCTNVSTYVDRVLCVCMYLSCNSV